MESSIEKTLWRSPLVIVIFFAVLLTCSCSPQQVLTEPGGDYKALRIEKNKVVAYSGTKEIKLKNKSKYEVDSNDFLILKTEFRYVGGMYP